jgi:outer membrane protein assembly factor BamB
VRLPDALTGDVATTTELWTTTLRKDRYYASPILHEGLIYTVTQGSVFSVIDAATGAVVYEKTLDLGKGTCYPSVTFAGGFLFVSSDNGKTLVLRPGRGYQEVAANTLEPFRGSPVFLDDKLFIRGFQNLYCLRAPATP